MWASANSTVLVLLLSAACYKAAPAGGATLAPRDDGVALLNEPCYGTHHHGDGACDGYMVCCVAAGTCQSKHGGMLSSNDKYYEGGCVGTGASKNHWNQAPKNATCKQQGECLPQILEACYGGTTKPGLMTEVPKTTKDRFMAGSCEFSCPAPRRHGGGSYSRGGGAKTDGTTTTPTTTTTTTVITRVSGTANLAISDVSAVSAAAMKPLVAMSIGALAGFGADGSIVTVEMPSSLTATMAITYHFDVTNLKAKSSGVQPGDIKSNLAAHSNARINEVFAMYIGSCSYTVTVSAMKISDAAPADSSDTTADAHRANGIMMASMAAAAVIVA